MNILKKIEPDKLFLFINDAIKKAKLNNSEILFSYSFRFESSDLLPIVTHPSDRQHLRFYWEQPSKGFSLAGLNSIWDYNYDNNKGKPYNEIITEVKSLFNNAITLTDSPLVGPKLIGGHAFNLESEPDDTWIGFPRFRFFIPECLATMNDDGSWLTLSTFVHKDISIDKMYKNFNQLCIHYQNRMPVTIPSVTRVEVDKFRDIPNKNEWNKTICSVLEEIHPGEVEKVVISRSHHIKISKDFSVSSALQILRNTYPSCTTFMYAFPSQGIFFGSTPERLVKLKKDYIETEALAGTQARGKNMEEDRLLSEMLINSHKENEEHNIVVEQINWLIN